MTGTILSLALLAMIALASCGLPSMMAWPRRDKLFRAAESGDVKQVEQLLDSGLDVDTSDRFDERALHRAAAYGQCEVLRVLLQRGAKTDDAIAELALRDAISGDHICAVGLLLDGGVSANANFYLGGTPLMSAAERNSPDSARLLLQHGADPNLLGHYAGSVTLEPCTATALIVASKHGNLSTVKMLVGAGADVAYRDTFGCSARDAAEQGGHDEIVSALEAALK